MIKFKLYKYHQPETKKREVLHILKDIKNEMDIVKIFNIAN